MTTEEKRPSTPSNRRVRLWVAAGVFTLIGAGYAGWYLSWGQYHETTDDAYVNANLVYVQAQVGGTVTALGADDNQPVHVGQLLVSLDDADAKTALASAEAQLGETVRQIRGSFLAVDTAAATVKQRQADLDKVTGDLQRRSRLIGGETVSVEDLAHARDLVASAHHALNVAEKQLAQTQAAVANTQLIQHPSVQRARASYIQASLNLQRSEIPAPVEGVIAKRSVQVGQRINPGVSLLAVVPLHAAWVDANLKESQLKHIRIGQPVEISADLYGSKIHYRGQVASLSAGTGGAFSLLPPQNATGNWIKVVQRVPVRIALNPDDLTAHPLRVGLSAEVDIDTHQRDGDLLQARPLPNVVLNTNVFAHQLTQAEQQADAIIAHEVGVH